MKKKKTFKRIYKPFPEIIIPCFYDDSVSSAIDLARNLSGRVTFAGMVPVGSDDSLSGGAAMARSIRQRLRSYTKTIEKFGTPIICVSHDPWQELMQRIRENRPDLLVLEYPSHFVGEHKIPAEFLNNNLCDIAVVRGPLPVEIKTTFIPLRGGPFAQLALRMGLALPHGEIRAVHLKSSNTQEIEPPFRGLARVLPSLKDVTYQQIESDNPTAVILEESKQSDLLIMGASARPLPSGQWFGPITEHLLNAAPCAMVIVKTRDRLPEIWTGQEGELTGRQAISILVDSWFAENTYHGDEFDDLENLVALKKKQGVTISLALPALNEEATVGTVIKTIKSVLMDAIPLLDEIVLIDSNSTDQTREIASDLGIPVFIHQKILPSMGPRRGKGEALWKSLLVTRGDIIIWIDTDIVNIHPRFVYGVAGPLLLNPAVQFVKGFYRRPIKSDEMIQASGGGRVTELTARPLLNLFFPELSGVIQPLSGEYGGRRSALEKLPFFSGYGVEIGLLIEIFEKFGLGTIAQVDLLERIHHNQSLEALSKMSFAIIQAVLRKLEKRYNRPILEEVNKTMKLIRLEGSGYYLDVEEVSEMERPPMIDIPEYNERSKKKMHD
ncbi:MAG: glucosyl-3-phosphoglycerate synthase [Anaerolineaceae bacterium]